MKKVKRSDVPKMYRKNIKKNIAEFLLLALSAIIFALIIVCLFALA